MGEGRGWEENVIWSSVSEECVVNGRVVLCVTAADDDTIAESLRRSVRVLCWVMTTPDNHMSKAVHVQATWGRRCNVLLFVTEKDDVGALSVMKVDVATGREHLTAKTMSAFDHVYEHHRHEADWFMKVSQHRLNDRSPEETQIVAFCQHFALLVLKESSGGQQQRFLQVRCLSVTRQQCQSNEVIGKITMILTGGQSNLT